MAERLTIVSGVVIGGRQRSGRIKDSDPLIRAVIGNQQCLGKINESDPLISGSVTGYQQYLVGVNGGSSLPKFIVRIFSFFLVCFVTYNAYSEGSKVDGADNTESKRYKMHLIGLDNPICQDFEKLLNDLPPRTLVGNLKPILSLDGYSLPDWKRVKAEDYEHVFFESYKIRRGKELDEDAFEKHKNEIGGYRYYLADIDIDNSGKIRPVLMYERGELQGRDDSNFAKFFILNKSHHLGKDYYDDNSGRIFFKDGVTYLYVLRDPGYITKTYYKDSSRMSLVRVRGKAVCQYIKIGQ